MSRTEITAERPPSYLSRASLAAELDCSPSTVDELVRRGILPKPVRMTTGCVRWSWSAVKDALDLLGGTKHDADPFMTGARNATKTDSATAARRS